MTGTSTSLRPFGPDDLGLGYALASVAPERWPRLCRRGLPPPHELPVALAQTAAALWVVTTQEGPVGVASVHDLSTVHGTAWVDLVLIPGTDDGVLAAAARALVDGALDRWDLRILLEAHRGIDGSILDASGHPTRRQAILPDYLLADGDRWDRIVTAVFRSDLEPRARRS